MQETAMSTWADKEASIKALERNGRVKPDDLIEAARSPDHPCHSDFTWDTQKAAAERLRDQARGLIRRVQFQVVVDDISERVVHYVASDQDEGRDFASLPKLKRVSTVSAIMASEIAMLHGLASRVYGIALAKQAMVGDDMVTQLRDVRDLLARLKAKARNE